MPLLSLRLQALSVDQAWESRQKLRSGFWRALKGCVQPRCAPLRVANHTRRSEWTGAQRSNRAGPRAACRHGAQNGRGRVASNAAVFGCGIGGNPGGNPMTGTVAHSRNGKPLLVQKSGRFGQRSRRSWAVDSNKSQRSWSVKRS